MKKLGSVAVALLLLVVGGLVIVPRITDWNRFKEPLAEALRAACGHPVVLAGDVSLSLLPVPTLSAADVGIANPAGAARPQLLHLGRLDARVALLPLLGGRIEIERVALDHPTLVLETLADGRRAWLAADGTATPALPPTLRLDRLDITDGTVLWQDDAAGTSLQATAVAAAIDAAGRDGPFALRAAAVIRDTPVTLEATTGALGDGAALPLQLTLALADGSASLHFSGTAPTGWPATGWPATGWPATGWPATGWPATGWGESGKPPGRLQGDLRVEAASAADSSVRLAALMGAPLTAASQQLPALKQPLSLHAAILAGAAETTLSGLELRLGELTATGSARFTPGTPQAFDVQLAASRLDLAPWLSPWLSGRPDADAALAGLSGLPPAAGVTLRLELAVDALGVGPDVLRQARLDARLADGTLTVERLSVQGPGGSELVVAGSLGRAGDRPQADITLEADADNLRMLMDALHLTAAAVPADRLRRMSLVARLRGRPDEFQLTGLDLRVDTSRITGGVAYRNTGRPAFGVRLDLDHLDVDAYRPEGRLPAGVDPAAAGRALAALLARGDINLQAHLGHLTVDGLPLRDLDLDLTADHGALTIRSARIADLAGLAAGVKGTLAGLDPVRGADLEFTGELGSVVSLEHLSTLTLPPPLHRLGPVKLAGHAAGDGEKLALTFTSDVLGGRIEAAGTLAPMTGRLADPLTLHGVFPRSGPVIRLFSPDYRPEAGDDPGATDLSLTLAADPGRLHLTGLRGTLAGVTVEGEVTTLFDGERPSVDARLRTGEIVLETLWPASGPPVARHWLNLWPASPSAGRRTWSVDPLDLGWLDAAAVRLALDAAGLTVQGRRLGTPVLRASLSDGSLHLEQFDGELMQGRLGATGRLALLPPPDGAEAALTVNLVGARIEHGLLYAGSLPGAVDVDTGTLDLDLDLKTRGTSELALAGGLAGGGRIVIRDGRLAGVDLPDLDRRLAAIHRPQDVVGLLTVGQDEAGGTTPFDRLQGSATIDHGVVTTTDLQLATPAGTGSAQGFIDLPNRVLSLAMRFLMSHQPPLPAINVTVSGSLDQPRRTIDTQDLQAFMTHQFAVPAASQPAQAAPGAIPPGDFLRNLFHSRAVPPSQPTPSQPVPQAP